MYLNAIYFSLSILVNMEEKGPSSQVLILYVIVTILRVDMLYPVCRTAVTKAGHKGAMDHKIVYKIYIYIVYNVYSIIVYDDSVYHHNCAHIKLDLIFPRKACVVVWTK